MEAPSATWNSMMLPRARLLLMTSPAGRRAQAGLLGAKTVSAVALFRSSGDSPAAHAKEIQLTLRN